VTEQLSLTGTVQNKNKANNGAAKKYQSRIKTPLTGIFF